MFVISNTMSGALVQLVAKGTQDAYLTSNDGESFFKMKFTRYTEFSQAAKLLNVIGTIQNNDTSSVIINSSGDLINHIWLEGTNIISNLGGCIFDLYIGGQLIDSQTFDFMADVWQIYMAETYSKCQTINNNVSQSDLNFFPLHFFFCDNQMFLPLISLQYHQVEIKIRWGSTIQNVSNLRVYGNYIYLDTTERLQMVNKNINMLITQVQKIESSDMTTLDLSTINHPIKSIFFGYPQAGTGDFWTFDNADIILNGTYLLENMSPTYFHTVQGYYGTQYGIINFININNSPKFTQYYMYNFSLDVSSYKPTGTCNFSRLDNARLNISNANSTNLTLYAVNYNILRINKGLAGILFSN